MNLYLIITNLLVFLAAEF